MERHVKSLATHLIADGHRVTVVTLGGGPGETVTDGIRVIRLGDWLRVGDVLSFPLPGATARILRMLEGAGVTAVSTHTRFFPMTVVGVRVARRLGVAVVHTEHGSGFVRGVNPLVGLASRLVDLTAGRWALRRAEIVLAVSEQVADFVARLAGVGARLFYNAVDVEVWRAAATHPRARLVYVGRLVPGKGWRELLAAAVALRARPGPRFEVALYGDGPEAGDLADEVRRLELGDLVTHHGQVGREVLAEGVAGAVLVNPTTLAEGFQTSILEVIAAGGRVVTYDVAGAGVLAADGAPVRVVPATEDALVGAIIAELETPSPAYPGVRLARWGWGSRAQEYAAVLAEVSVPPGERS